MASSVLVLGIIVVGGVTRLTESGLSITEWRPITGILPPLSYEDWATEFEKYRATPEFKLYEFPIVMFQTSNHLSLDSLNHSISLEEFKSIFYMEWGHRILGRLIGVVFVGPLAYYSLRRKIPKALTLRLLGLATLIGAQGAIGWYMVKSGLEDSLLETPGATPRVSQYRLAAHLGMAFLLYFGMFWSGMAIIKDCKFAKGAAWSGYKGDSIEKVLKNPLVKSFKRQTGIVTGLVLLTALSGRGITKNTVHFPE
jgi:cytochrome c oxidase assembly protein subunit 15